MLYQGCQVSILDYPLGGRLLAHLWDARQIIRRIATQRGKVRVLRGGETVLLFYRGRGKAVERGYALHRIEHRRRLINQLQVVTVSSDDESLIVLCLGCESSQNVIGLVVLTREGGNAQHLEHLANEVYLTLEFLRRGLALGLIFREHLSAEGLAPHVECHRNGVGGLFRHDIREHR